MKKTLLYLSLFTLLFISTNNTYAGTLDPFSYVADSYVEGKTTTYTFTYTTETEILSSEVGGQIIFRATLGASEGVTIPVPLNATVTVDGVSTIPLEIYSDGGIYIRLGIDVPANSEVVVILPGIVNRSAGTYDWTDELFTADGGANAIDRPATIDDLVITADVTSPAIESLSPTGGSVDILVDTDLVVTFDEVVDVEAGDIFIHKTGDDSLVETIDSTSDKVTGSGTDTITINPTDDLDSETGYYVLIDTTVFDDNFGNSFEGILAIDTWDFTTASAPLVTTVTSSKSTSRQYGCKDVSAINYEVFSSHKQSLCEYEINRPTDPVVIPQTTQAETISTAIIFTRDLELGVTHPDVIELQKFLNNSGFTVSLSGPGSIGNETDSFGPLTKAALIKFQDSNSEAILSPVGLLKGTGYFGKSTISFISSL